MSAMPSPDASFDAPTRAGLRRRLRAWYRAHRRPMPWRETRDPYPIWVSEVMLQQTQVATATPFYRRFLERFPSLNSLATAPVADVLESWAGLGYYRRARHLHEAARTVVRDHRGAVPAEPETFGRLPGVGRYTTAAVLSICFDRPLAVLDGNVARVLSRLVARPLAVRRPRDAARLWSLAQSLVPMQNPGDWNQAMMELGAIVCTPRAPRCNVCPIAMHCRARALGTVEDYPPVVERRAEVRERRALAWIERGGRVLLEQRTGALLDGLWEPPGVDLADAATSARGLAAHLKSLGLDVALRRTDVQVRHTITHRTIEVALWRGMMKGRTPRRASLRWVSLDAPGVALTALTGKMARAVAAAR